MGSRPSEGTLGSCYYPTPTKRQYMGVHHIDYKSSAKMSDEIHLKTYVTRSEGVTSTRIVDMYNIKNGKLIVKSETIWCLLDVLTKKPKRITSEIADVFR
jgi:acyl-CoA thioester hydrolase